MFMKKKLAVLLTVTLLAACAAGCSSTAEEKKETNTTAAQESVSEASTDEGDKTKAAESDVELTFLHGQELLKRLCWKKLLQDLQMLRE